MTVELLQPKLAEHSVAQLRELLQRAENGDIKGFVCVVDTGNQIEYFRSGLSIAMSLGYVQRLSYWLNKKWDYADSEAQIR